MRTLKDILKESNKKDFILYYDRPHNKFYMSKPGKADSISGTDKNFVHWIQEFFKPEIKPGHTLETIKKSLHTNKKLVVGEQKINSLKDIHNQILFEQEFILSEMDLGQWNNLQISVAQQVAHKKKISVDELFMKTNYPSVFAQVVDRGDKQPTNMKEIIKKILIGLK